MSVISIKDGDAFTSSQDEVGVIAGNYATQSYVNTAISNLIDGAPSTLDTLNEIAAALDDNAAFSDTVVLKSGSTMTGDLILNADPTNALGAATKQFVESGTSTLSNKTLSNPYIENIYTTNKYFFHSAFTFGPFIPASTSFVLSNWQSGSDGTINVWQLATAKEKTFFRIDAQNDGTNVNAGSFVTGDKYIITSAGTTDFTAVGAADNNVNTVFTATGAGSGSGTADTWDTGDMRVDFSLKGGDNRGEETAGSFDTGAIYEILTVGTTDFTAIGASSNTVGELFTATGAGSGDGVAIDTRHHKGKVNQFGAFTSTSASPHDTRLGLTGYRISMYGPTDGYTFPHKDGSAGQVLTTDGNGNLRFDAPETITLATLKTEVAASSDFADFKSRIAAL